MCTVAHTQCFSLQANSSDWKQGAPSTDVPHVLSSGPLEPEGDFSQGPSESLTSPGGSTEEELEVSASDGGLCQGDR